MERDILDQHLHALERDGYTILENAIEPELVDTIRTRVRAFEKESLGAQFGQAVGRDLQRLRTGGLLHLDPAFWDVPTHPEVLPVVEGVLGASVLLTTLSSIDLMPGKNMQPIHPDDALIPLERPHQPIVCTCMWAITDFTEENGATRVLPGSHRADAMPESDKYYEGLVVGEMRAGSVLVLSGSLWHQPADNTTEEGRLGLQVSYCAAWLRPVRLTRERDVHRSSGPKRARTSGSAGRRANGLIRGSTTVRPGAQRSQCPKAASWMRRALTSIGSRPL